MPELRSCEDSYSERVRVHSGVPTNTQSDEEDKNLPMCAPFAMTSFQQREPSAER